MRRLLRCLAAAAVMLAICAAAAAEPRMELVDTQQVPENRNFRGAYVADKFEGKVVMTDIKGSKVSSKPWIAFYGRMGDGSSIKFELEFQDGNIQVCALYKGDTKGMLDRKYLLRETLPANDKWRYNGTFVAQVVDGSAVISLGGKSYTWPGVSFLTGEMEVARVSGKLEVYNWIRE